MFRRLIDRAITAVADWIAEPAQTPAGAPPPPPRTDPRGEWDAEAFERKWLAWERCPFCAKPKEPGAKMCGPCDDFRKPLREKAAKVKP